MYQVGTITVGTLCRLGNRDAFVVRPTLERMNWKCQCTRVYKQGTQHAHVRKKIALLFWCSIYIYIYILPSWGAPLFQG